MKKYTYEVWKKQIGRNCPTDTCCRCDEAWDYFDSLKELKEGLKSYRDEDGVLRDFYVVRVERVRVKL